MGKTEERVYWLGKALTCNGCKFCNFYKSGCRKDQPPGQVRTLSSYENRSGFIALLKPSDCNYQNIKSQLVHISHNYKGV